MSWHVELYRYCKGLLAAITFLGRLLGMRLLRGRKLSRNLLAVKSFLLWKPGVTVSQLPVCFALPIERRNRLSSGNWSLLARVVMVDSLAFSRDLLAAWCFEEQSLL